MWNPIERYTDRRLESIRASYPGDYKYYFRHTFLYCCRTLRNSEETEDFGLFMGKFDEKAGKLRKMAARKLLNPRSNDMEILQHVASYEGIEHAVEMMTPVPRETPEYTFQFSEQI